MHTGIIKQNIFFKASKQEVYNLLMDEKMHSSFTGSPVIMSSEINGKFDVFDGYCKGHNIELIKNEKIVQAWQFAEDGWDNDHYSICTFVFNEKDGGTELSFTQEKIPNHKVQDLENGWNEYYWEPMMAYLN
jgi:activator of HSP90 ATPase